MNKVFVVFLLVLSFVSVNNYDINGEWEIIYVKTPNYTYDKKTNQVDFSRTYRRFVKTSNRKQLDFPTLEKIEAEIKMKDSNNWFVFDKNGIYQRRTDFDVFVEGSYEVDSINKIIKTSAKNISKNTLGSHEYRSRRELKTNMNYYFENGLLHLSIGKFKDKQSTLFILKKNIN
ncbi:hypothetical protein [Seonamhaeicola maritimus]|uniref:hypothetical protein n=1 Tax=Seonamhaeicola maritimus TaxID=2591822 RepID=UPI002494BAF8|nr:hypothetical protein [Seonamhaeicola maritimus]